MKELKLQTAKISQEMIYDIIDIPGASITIKRRNHASIELYGDEIPAKPFTVAFFNISEALSDRYKNANRGDYRSNNRLWFILDDRETVRIYETEANRNFYTEFSINNNEWNYEFKIIK